MRKFNRAAEPAICTTHSEKWNNQWVALRNTNPNASFQWYRVENKSAHEHMLPTLYDQSQGHCCFCDAFPVRGVSNDTIEHFRPKSQFPHLAYTWINLYYCCDACQSAKHEQWDDQLLHADADDYQFSRYFEFDFTTGSIKPNSLANEADQKRAAVTITLYGLDSQARRRNRLWAAEDYAKPANKSNERLPYRDFLGAS
ncbi:MAG: TIGR02646 family protein [Phycisphaerales bacterium]|nr:TIGR02646 family protein [Phycisphaerales bacterium]